MKKDWEEIEKFFKLLERDETLDKQLKETTGSEEYFLIILESLSPLHTLEIRKEKERKEELKNYMICAASTKNSTRNWGPWRGSTADI